MEQPAGVNTLKNPPHGTLPCGAHPVNGNLYLHPLSQSPVNPYESFIIACIAGGNDPIGRMIGTAVTATVTDGGISLAAVLFLQQAYLLLQLVCFLLSSQLFAVVGIIRR